MMDFDPAQLFDSDSDPLMAQRLLETISRIINVTNNRKLSYRSRMEKILSLILDYLGVEQGSIMILGKKNNLEIVAASKAELVGHIQNLDENTIATWVVKNREPLFIPDISKDSRFESRKAKYKKKGLMSAPIMNQDRVIGAINVTDKSGDKDFFKDDIKYLLEFSSVILWLAAQENLHDEIKKQRNTLKKRNKELRRQEASRAELSKLLIHDLKAPLSEIIANLDILSYTIPEEFTEFLESARIGCERAVLMVSNLGTIDKIEDGKMQLIKEDIDPTSLLNESISSIRGLATIKDIEVTLEKDGSEPATVRLDRILILRVLQNLLTNAIGHSPRGTVISTGCAKVPGKKQIEFFVEDKGEGIPEDKCQTIFEKYARITKKQDSLIGTGLGLYFCKLAVETHRGKIWVKSKVGKGSRFVFTLPL